MQTDENWSFNKLDTMPAQSWNDFIGFKIDNQLLYLGKGESVHIPPGTPHMIFNNSNSVLQFIVISSPKSHGDRVGV